jgi:hypothetical protein
LLSQNYKKRNEERRQQEQERKIAREREVEAEITKRQMERLQREARVQQAQKEVWFKKREEVAAAKAELKTYKERTSIRQYEAVCLPTFTTRNIFVNGGQVHGAAAKSAEIRSRERQVGGRIIRSAHTSATASLCASERIFSHVSQAAVERAKRRESIELAAMQAYEEKLQKQEEERRKKSAGTSAGGGAARRWMRVSQLSLPS